MQVREEEGEPKSLRKVSRQTGYVDVTGWGWRNKGPEATQELKKYKVPLGFAGGALMSPKPEKMEL